MAETPLDRAHAAMLDGDDAARLKFFERLADAELSVLLASDPQGDQIEPQIFEVPAGRFVLAFDLDERLADFVGATAPYAALSGRLVARMLAGQGIGLGLNLNVAPSSFLIPADALDWLVKTLGNSPRRTTRQPTEILPPADIHADLLKALDAKLQIVGPAAATAYLATVKYGRGENCSMLAFVDTDPGAEHALVQAVGEALTFSGVDCGELNVGFFVGSDPVVERLARVGLRIDLPDTGTATGELRPPGTDPGTPPRLR